MRKGLITMSLQTLTLKQNKSYVLSGTMSKREREQSLHLCLNGKYIPAGCRKTYSVESAINKKGEKINSTAP